MFNSLGNFRATFEYIRENFGVANTKSRGEGVTKQNKFQDYREIFSPSRNDIEQVASKYLGSVSIFSEFSEFERCIVAGHFIEWIAFDRKTVVIECGKKINGLYIVLNGQLVENQSGDIIYEAGQCFGALSLIKDTFSSCNISAGNKALKCAFLSTSNFNFMLERLNIQNDKMTSSMKYENKNGNVGSTMEKRIIEYIGTMKSKLSNIRKCKEYVNLIKSNKERMFNIPVIPFSSEESPKTLMKKVQLADIDNDQIIKDYLREELLVIDSYVAPMGSHALFQAAFSMLHTDTEEALNRYYQKAFMPMGDIKAMDTSPSSIFDAKVLKAAVWKIMHESSRTINGGDAYNVVNSIFGDPDELIITPASALTKPTELYFLGNDCQCFIKAYNSFRACKFCLNGEEPQIWCHFHTIVKKEIQLRITDQKTRKISVVVVSNTVDVYLDDEPFESADEARAALAFRRVLTHGLELEETDNGKDNFMGKGISVKLSIPTDALQNNGSIWYSAKNSAPQLRIDTKLKVLAIGVKSNGVTPRRLWLPCINQISVKKLVTRKPSCPYEYCISLQRKIQRNGKVALESFLTIHVDTAQESKWLALGFKSTVLHAKHRESLESECTKTRKAKFYSSSEVSSGILNQNEEKNRSEKSKESENYAYIVDEECFTINLDSSLYREDNDVEINFLENLPGRKSTVSVSSPPPLLDEENQNSKRTLHLGPQDSPPHNDNVSDKDTLYKENKVEAEILDSDPDQSSTLWADKTVQHQLNLANEDLEREEIEQKMTENMLALKKNLKHFQLQMSTAKASNNAIQPNIAFQNHFSGIENKVNQLCIEIEKLV